MKRGNEEVDNTSNKKVKTIHQLNDEEAALYDRQIRLWGFDAQRRYNFKMKMKTSILSML